jgi:hypothetical protein
MMCDPEESVEAKSFPFLKGRGWSISPTTFFAKKVLRVLALAASESGPTYPKKP